MTPEALVDIGVPPRAGRAHDRYRGAGCANCNGTGYKGRLALYEVMPMADAIREAVIAGASTAEVKRAAIATGHVHAAPSGINKIAEGVTTVEEVLRDHHAGLRTTSEDARDDPSPAPRRRPDDAEQSGVYELTAALVTSWPTRIRRPGAWQYVRPMARH